MGYQPLGRCGSSARTTPHQSTCTARRTLPLADPESSSSPFSHLSKRIEKIEEDCVRARDENKSLRETVAKLKIELQKVHKQNEALEEKDRKRELEMADEMSENLAKQSEKVDQISCDSVVEQIVEQRNEKQRKF